MESRRGGLPKHPWVALLGQIIQTQCKTKIVSETLLPPKPNSKLEARGKSTQRIVITSYLQGMQRWVMLVALKMEELPCLSKNSLQLIPRHPHGDKPFYKDLLANFSCRLASLPCHPGCPPEFTLHHGSVTVWSMKSTSQISLNKA